MTQIRKDTADVSVLYVEDEAEAREMVSRVLTQEIPSLRLYTAENGETGLALYGEHQPDIVITDINMPMMDGIRMGNEIKSLNPDAIIIAVTAHSDTCYLLDAIETGISHYVLKPIDYDKLFAAIAKGIETVTLKKQVREQNDYIRQLSRAVEENPCSVVITDIRGAMEYVNPAFIGMTGYSSEESIGQIPAILKSNGMPLHTSEELRETIFSGKVWRGEFLNRKVNGESYWESASISPIFSDEGGITHFVAVSEDITARKQAEKELIDKNTELERFTYTVSHDLKSPLITIQSFAGMIRADLEAGRYDRVPGDLTRISDGAARMSMLLDDLLELSRVGRMMSPPATVEMGSLVADVLAQMAGPLGQMRIEVAVQPNLPPVRGDRQRIAEALQNLVENAVKYMGDQASPHIEIGVRKAGRECAFFVCDNGGGIEARHHESIFGLFTKLDAASEGTGIGLALVKRIIEVHGGRIWVESAGVGRGSCFCFTLPISAQTTA